ncbi:MAG: alpha-N-arabinofuranosidase [Clostridia bacterium]|nr:alpha-N-arabinofuranosidase [Clostridia bacterium]
MAKIVPIQMYVNAADRKSFISKNIYGNFSEHLGRCIYEGFFVGKDSSIPNTDGIRNDVVEAFRNIRLPVLRWPGGCFADEYHWKDGIGTPEERKKMINTHWGGVTEDNSFGTHEFMRLCELIGCEPYVNGNLGSGSVEEMSQWVEYITSDAVSPMTELRAKNGHPEPWKLKYFGVGNENWGCGGNMTPEYYANEYRRYNTYCRNYGENRLFRIACGPNGRDFNWMQKLMENIPLSQVDGISLHYYSSTFWDSKQPGGESINCSATQFGEKEYYQLLHLGYRMEDIITRHDGIMTRFDPEKRIALMVDEWGSWYDVEPGTNPGFLYQQNTMRDALLAAVTLDIFNRHSDRVRMANIAQAVNVLQSVILTEGAKMVKTPTYHVFDLYKEHQDATLVYSYNDNETVSEHHLNALSQTVSFKDGALHITASNLALDRDYEISCDIRGFEAAQVEGRLLTGAFNAYNDFDAPEAVALQPLTGIKLESGLLTFTLPACSVAALTLR